MSILGRLLGFFSLLANLVLGVVLIGIGLIGALEGAELHIDEIPVAPEMMAQTLMVGGVAALLAVALAIRPGRLSRSFLALWSLLIVGLVLCAFARSSYQFDGMEHFRQGVWVLLASLVLLIGSVFHWKYAPSASREAR